MRKRAAVQGRPRTLSTLWEGNCSAFAFVMHPFSLYHLFCEPSQLILFFINSVINEDDDDGKFVCCSPGVPLFSLFSFFYLRFVNLHHCSCKKNSSFHI